MPLDPDLAAWLRLSLTPGLGGEALRRLLTALGGPQQVLAARRGELARYVGAALAASIPEYDATAALSAAGAWLEDPANDIVTLADTRYPRQLLQIPDPPPLLHVKGRVELLSRPALAIVGSRNATARWRTNWPRAARSFPSFRSA